MRFYSNDVESLAPRRSRPGFIDDPQLGLFLEALPDGAALVEMDGRIRLANGRLAIVLNIALADLVGTDLSRHVKTAGPIFQKLCAALQQRKRIELSGTLNSQRNVVATLNMLRTDDGGAFGALLTLREAGRHARLADGSEGFALGRGAGTGPGFVRIPETDAIVERARSALVRGANVLLTGETGTGKTRLAQRIDAGGDAGAVPFVHVRCGMLSDAQFEVEMFGIEPGSSMDSSTRGRLGYVEAADEGILFLDDITDLSLPSQARLVAFLEAQTFSRLGSTQRRRARVRVIAATSEDLPGRIAAGAFRRDLYYRIAVMPFALPALRDRPDFLRLLVEDFLRRLNTGRAPALRMAPDFLPRLRAHGLPGNIRELLNILERAAALADDALGPEHVIAPALHAGNAAGAESHAIPAGLPGGTLKDMVKEFEGWVIRKAMDEHGSKRGASKALGVDIATVVRKTRQTGTSTEPKGGRK